MKSLFFCIIYAFLGLLMSQNAEGGYQSYHQKIIEAEKLIVDHQYSEALVIYNQVFANYDFVFLRDYKVAVQLALKSSDYEAAMEYVKAAARNGWTLKSMNKVDYLVELRERPEWKAFEEVYPDLHQVYKTRINHELRERVHEMFKKDQWMALGALFRIGDKAQQRYGDRKFAPHSINQLENLIKILNEHGYPGERLVGNNFWMSTVLSHHNSVSDGFVKNDTLYNYVKPMLREAVDAGYMSPYEYALIADWRIAVMTDRAGPGYGFLNRPKVSQLEETNKLRAAIGLRTVQLRNQLVEIEEETGLNMYLPDWIKGEIEIGAD